MGRGDKAVIPQQIEEMTADWFSEMFDRPERVTSVEATVVGTDIGFMGELFRFALEWDAIDRPDLPQSVIVKVPSTKPENRALGEGLRAYEREIEIYRALGGEFGIPMPTHHHSVMDPDPAPWLERPIIFLFEKLPIRGVDWLLLKFLKMSPKIMRRYLLVIEDIADARPPTQAEGGSLADTELALQVLARFHASNWMRQDRVEAASRIFPVNMTPKVMQAAYQRNRDDFIERWGESVGPATVARLDDIQQRLPEVVDRLVAEPWTVIHGDYRLDNVLYRPDGEIVVIDYQAVGWGRAGFDVAYFITTALLPEHKSEEEALLRAYHDALVGAGVSDYPWDELVSDCTLSKGMLAHRFVGGRDFVDSAVAGSDETFIDLLATRVLGWLDD